MSQAQDLQDLYGDTIYSYTEEDAIRDGQLHHIDPKAWPWLLVTNTVYRECERVAEERERYAADGSVHVEPVLYHLVTDFIMEVQKLMARNPRLDIVELEHTAIGTVWARPNAKGGMTIMKPEDNRDHEPSR